MACTVNQRVPAGASQLWYVYMWSGTQWIGRARDVHNPILALCDGRGAGGVRMQPRSLGRRRLIADFLFYAYVYTTDVHISSARPKALSVCTSSVWVIGPGYTGRARAQRCAQRRGTLGWIHFSRHHEKETHRALSPAPHFPPCLPRRGPLALQPPSMGPGNFSPQSV